MSFKGQLSLHLAIVLVFLTANSSLFGQAISGQVLSTTGEAMEAVSVALNDDMSNASATFSDGSYRFWTLPNAENFVVKPFKEESNHLNGVSTYDLVLITRHILGTQRFENSFQMVAADTDASGTITTFDVIKLRKLILRIDETFTHTTPWRFVDADYVFPGTSSSSVPDFPQEREVGAEDTNNNAVNFIGVKTGDVNGSARPNNFTGIDERNNEISVLNTSPQQVGNQLVTTFSTNDFSNFSAIQFTINFDPNQLAFRSIDALKLAGLQEEHLGLDHLSAGKITLSWFTTEAIAFAKNDALFALNFTPLTDDITTAVTITSDLTPALAYDENGLEKAVLNQDTNAPDNTPLSIAPNPVTTTATLSYQAETAGQATLNIFALNGQLLKTYQQENTVGLNQIKLSRADFTTQGAVIYQLISNEKAVSGRLLLN